MKFSTAASAVSAFALASLASAQTINTPTALYTCQAVALSWSGGTAPYYVRVFPGGQTTSALETLQSAVSTTSYSWKVDVAAGTAVNLGLTDASGTTVYSGIVTVQDGGDSSCVGAASASGSSTAAAAAGASSSAAPASSAATSASSSAAGVAASASSKAASATSAAASAASSAGSKASSAAAAATSAASGSSGASTLAVSGVLGFAALGAAIMA